jgi:hypothetical protein
MKLINKKIKKDVFLLEGVLKDIELIKILKNKIVNETMTNSVDQRNVLGKSTNYQFFINDVDFINFIKSIKKEIDKIYPYDFIIREAWGNVYNKNNYAKEHTHMDTTAFCGIIYLSENGPGTYFPELKFTVKEKIGKFVLFSPILKHSVKKCNGNRITLAFNMDECKPWINYEKLNNFKYI